jgi:hypothetical protein
VNQQCRSLVMAAFVAVVIVMPASAASRLDPDKPQQLQGMEAVCTGIGLEARADPRWQAYSLKVEVAGKGGQYLGDLTLFLQQNGKELAAVQCDGPWILFRLPAGRYQIEAQTEGKTARSGAIVPAEGQGRVILRFPDTGGEIAPPMQENPPQ